MVIVCVVHGGVAEAYKFFSAGPACRSCVLKADRIFAVYSIDGVQFREELKERSGRGQRPEKREEVVRKC